MKLRNAKTCILCFLHFIFSSVHFLLKQNESSSDVFSLSKNSRMSKLSDEIKNSAPSAQLIGNLVFVAHQVNNNKQITHRLSTSGRMKQRYAFEFRIYYFCLMTKSLEFVIDNYQLRLSVVDHYYIHFIIFLMKCKRRRN